MKTAIPDLSIRNRKTQAFLFILAFVFCFTVNQLNRSYLKKHNEKNVNSKSVVHNGSIYSIDNNFYLTPAINFIKYRVYSIDINNPALKVRRTPGYSIFYGLHYVLLGEVRAHQVIVCTQTMLFALSVVLLGLGVYNFTKNNVLSLLVSVLYACCPFVAGFTFYTVTESIHPQFVVYGFYFLSKVYTDARAWPVVASGIFYACATLIRPANILWGIPIILVLIFKYLDERSVVRFIKRSSLAFAGFIVLMGPWTVRNYYVTNGEFIPLEKFYDESPMGMGRSQTYMSRWWMCFGNPHPENLVFEMLKGNELPPDKKYDGIKNFVNDLPPYAFEGASKKKAEEALQCMQDCYHEKEKIYGTPIITLTPDMNEADCEFACKDKFKELISRYKAAAPFRYYFISPYIIRGKEFLLQSFSSMYGSLNPADKDFSWIQALIKGAMYILNVSLILSCLACFFSKGFWRLKITITSFIVATFIFYVNVSHIETRYLIAAYPFLYICLAIVLLGIVKAIRHKLHRPATLL